ncbi:JAB domain-containing protein, partial [Myroides odoratimimus]|uniref:JAB domain-containing protein n=1 Tax=Myroides odoratimimus TaxID=76832 RepID=UPI00257636BF
SSLYYFKQTYYLTLAYEIWAWSGGYIITHNHPSGNKQPSVQDIELTDRIKKAGDILNIPLLDHIILTHNDYFSFKSNKMI